MKNYKKVGISNSKHLNNEISYYKECIRFLPSERVNDYSTSDAINYDRLREAGMKRNKALQFCTAHHCKIDSTQVKHGPPGLKIFKTKIDKFKQQNGWQMIGRLNYEESMQQEYSDDTKWQIQVQNKEESKKLEQLKQFYSDLDIKYSFNDLNLDETVTKLRSLSTEQNYKSRVPQHQIKDSKNNIMYYELAEYILQLKKPQNTLISDLCAFDDSLPLARQEYYEIQPKRIENAVPLYSPSNCEKRSKLIKALTRAYTGNVTITEPSEEIKKIDFNKSQYVQGYKQKKVNVGVLQCLNENEQQKSRKLKQKCSIMTQRISRQCSEEERIDKNAQFNNKLKDFVHKSIKRLNYQGNKQLF